jgi:transcription antitermination protein NusB
MSCLQILYQIEIGKVTCLFAFQDYFSKGEFISSHKDFSQFLVQGVRDNLTDLDRVISVHAKNWKIARMAVVDKNILRMGVFELLYTKDIPPRVTINECVELAKKFGDTDSPKFINGILDSVYKKERYPKDS